MKGHTDDKLIPDTHENNFDNKNSMKKKRKRKPKNKCKELNLEQKKDLGIFENPVSSSAKEVKKLPTTQKSESTECTKEQKTSSVVCKDDCTKQQNTKRKRSKSLESTKEKQLLDKKLKLSEDKKDESKKMKFSKNDKDSNISANSDKSQVKQMGSNFKLNKLKMVLQKNNDKKDTPVKTEKAKVLQKNESPVKVGSLRERMMQKLASARFRFINEDLYNMTSNEAVDMFEEDNEAFKVYHKGYSTQVTKWPENPVDNMIKYINSKEGKLVIADFGCGEAKIAQNAEGKTVHSFDLVALNNLVTVCDISKVPLASKSVDIVVFCLSLMGTNLVNYLCEASRVLMKNGILLVAEVKSRFEKVGEFIRKMKKLGFSLIDKDESNKMFYWFEFQKTSIPPMKEKLPKIELGSCLYKRR